MKIWQRLYCTIWLAFFSCVLIPRWMGSYAGSAAHVLLGVALLILTLSNARLLKTMPVPQRLKRISTVTTGFAIFQVVNGLALGAVTHLYPDLPAAGAALRGLHVVCALTILAQASSVATAYDMWEEREFENASLDKNPDNS